MKLSVSVSDETARDLSTRARSAASGNASLVVEAALRSFFSLSLDQAQRLIERVQVDRKAVTRSGWAEAFWDVLGDLMGQPDQDVFNSPYSPRRFGPFYAVLLMNHMARPDDEDDPFIPHIGPMPVTPTSPPPMQWTFERSISPVVAAETVAKQLREYGVTTE